ncbi:DUF6428 family protein [Galbibacter sp. EGI 63066]|uniref:DUF6428 family protein n=1 Tax=Galbibacter sp. EGI 63066 TaxID=2993559 RepID=UPI0022487755|nr:DUF6428 family protein [Galbibacter sp. EGI 63066]MCX2681720.1 DUF6428 family protein [Galbibacter sp. EGI 63066]
MKLSAFKNHLKGLETIAFQLPDGSLVPNHFHVTEVGAVDKKFIDCGGTIRDEKMVNFQLWDANDYDHRLHPEKLTHIIELSEKVLGLGDHEIEVEYQGESISKFGVDFQDGTFLLTTKQTTCLAQDACGVPEQKQKVKLSELNKEAAAGCAPGSGCC